MIEEQNNVAWRMLLKSLEESEDRILCLRQREIDLLQKLMVSEENVKALIKVIADLKFKPVEPSIVSVVEKVGMEGEK